MKKNGHALCCFLFLSLAATACNSDPTTAEQVVIDLTADPAQTSTSEAVEFSLSASTSNFTITSSRIDYDGDGGWDALTPHNDSTIAATYEHRYEAEGHYTARAEVLEGLEVLDWDEATVDVSDLGVRLVLQHLDNPPVTVEVGSQGGCMMWIPYWTAQIENVATMQLYPPNHGLVHLFWAEMEFEWPDGATSPATHSHPIGGYMMPGESVEVQFNPINCCDHDRLGLTAQVKMTFVGDVDSTREIRLVAHSVLRLEECP